jgi:hypothetical protein
VPLRITYSFDQDPLDRGLRILPGDAVSALWSQRRLQRLTLPGVETSKERLKLSPVTAMS